MKYEIIQTQESMLEATGRLELTAENEWEQKFLGDMLKSIGEIVGSNAYSLIPAGVIHSRTSQGNLEEGNVERLLYLISEGLEWNTK